MVCLRVKYLGACCAVFGLSFSVGLSVQAAEVILRNSIGPNNTTTNGNFEFASNTSPGFFWDNAPGTVLASENVTLKEVRVIFGQGSDVHDFSKLDYTVRIWGSEADAIASPNSGNIANIFFDVPSTGPTLYGTHGDEGIGPQPTFEMKFNIQSQGIQVLSGQTRLIGVQIKTLGWENGGLWGMMESKEVGPSDIWLSDTAFPNGNHWMYIKDDPYSLYDGRLAYEVTAETLAPVCPNGTCESGESSCNCPQDCGAPPSHEVAGSTCADGIDNDCDKATDCADSDCATDAVACPNGRIPAVSEWGVLVLSLLTLTAGTLVCRRRHVAA